MGVDAIILIILLSSPFAHVHTPPILLLEFVHSFLLFMFLLLFLYHFDVLVFETIHCLFEKSNVRLYMLHVLKTKL